MTKRNFRRRVFRGVFSCTIALLSSLSCTNAFAHDELIASTPADESTVSASTSLQLEFSDPLITTGYRLQLTGPAGKVSVSPGIAGAVLRADFPGKLPAGKYQVNWRVVSEDGHPISGTFSYTVTGPPPAPKPLESPKPVRATPEVNSSTLAQAPVQTTANQANLSQGSIAPWLGAGAAIIGAGALGIFSGRRRRRTASGRA